MSKKDMEKKQLFQVNFFYPHSTNWHVGCSFDVPIENFLPDGQKLSAPCPKMMKNFDLFKKIVYLKMIFWRRTTPFWKLHGKNSTRTEKFSQILRSWSAKCISFNKKFFYLGFYGQVFLRTRFYGQVVCSLRTLARNFWQKAESFAVNFQNWSRVLIFFPKNLFTGVPIDM